MRYRLTYVRDGGSGVDLDVSADGVATVADLADALQGRDPQRKRDITPNPTITMAAPTGQLMLPAEQLLADSALRSGSTIGISPTPHSTRATGSSAVAMLIIVEGPQAGQEFPLRRGINRIGRDSSMDVALKDPLVSREHARINVNDTIEIVDNNSANGIYTVTRQVGDNGLQGGINGLAVTRSVLHEGQHLLIGETTFTVRRLTPRTSDPTQHLAASGFIRPPRLAPHFDEETYPTPELPRRPQPSRFPLIALVTPILMGGVLYAVTRQIASLLFVAMSPLMLIGNWVENRTFGKKQYRQQLEEFQAELARLGDLIQRRQAQERELRAEENPSSAAILDAITQHDALLWARRPDHPEFGQLRLGLGRVPSRVRIELPVSQAADASLWQQLLDFQARWSDVDAVPVVADLKSCGSVGVAGRGERGTAIARAIILQAAGLHSPADLAIAACVGTTSTPDWDWLKWLPHTMPTHSPVGTELLSDGPASTVALITALEDLIDERSDTQHKGDAPVNTPVVLLVVTNDAAIDRSRLVWLAENGPAAGIHVMWSAPRLAELPAACRAYVSVDEHDHAHVGFVNDSQAVSPLTAERINLPTATHAARSLAPVVDSGARVEDESDLPGAIPYLALAGQALAEDATAITERWIETDSLPSHRKPGKRRGPSTLRALIGQGASESIALDLKAQGPHALVGGTTGSGKSELLQTWVLSMAAAYSPERVTFLFVDYKGGSAFGECVNLPHSVGLVTDLSPHLVRRALLSLNAELRHREHILNAAKAKDLESMERKGHPNTPPSLVIVVDEFAALASDVPEFVDGVVNVAQRGRSLGLHLILATQRPAGVIKDNLRANTNLRLALRMADEADSNDVLGEAAAAHFDPQAPGRAAARIGSSRLISFQSAYVGGHTHAGEKVAEISVAEVSIGVGARWRQPEADSPVMVEPEGTTDLQKLVATISQAATDESLTPPRRPWLPELPHEIDLANLSLASRTDERLIFGLGDLPENQDQPLIAFHPDIDGNLAVFGTGGTGKSGTLRSLAVSAGNTVKGGPVHVYGLDFGSQGLHMLEPLPHVGSVITGDDTERVVRLLRTTRRVIDERAVKYSAAQASSITEYRARAATPDEPRILLLLDGLASFRQAHDTALPGSPLDILTSIAADGRSVGVHVVISADRPATMPSALGSLISRRLVLRQADDNDLLLLGVPKDVFTIQSPAGRGYLDGHELQVAVLGGDASVAVQSRAIERLTAAIRKHTSWPDAPAIQRLSEHISLDNLPTEVDGAPAFGVADETLAPVGLPQDGTFVVTGPPASGRTTTVATIIRAVKRARPLTRCVLLSPGRSALAGLAKWAALATDADKVAELAGNLTAQVQADPAGSWLIIIESAADMVNSAADFPLQELVKAARIGGQLIVGEGDTQAMSGSWPLQQALRFSRRGIALQPDQTDGDMLFRTSFPRIKRADFPQGRGLLVREGRWIRVQVAES